MSWFSGFGSPKSNLPAVTPLQAQRAKQIESLRTLNPNVVELKRDEEYRVGFSCGANNVTFTISLPADFPQTKPVITVAPPMRHGLVDESMQVVRYLPLINFNVQTDLGRLVQNLIQDFSKVPMFIQPDASQQRTIPTVPQYQHFRPQPGPTQQQLPPLQHPLPPHHPLQQHQTPHQPSPPHHPSSHMTPPHPNMTPPQSNMTPPHPNMTTPHMNMPSATPPNQFTPQMPTPHPPSNASSYPSSSSVPVTTSSSSSSSSTAVIPMNGLNVEPNTPVPGISSSFGMSDFHRYTMPAIPPSFDDLFKDYTQEQLQDLIDDEEKLDDIFRNVPQLSKMHTDRTELYQSCEEIAKLNLSYQPEIVRLRRELGETVKFRNELKNNFELKCQQQQSLNEQCSLSHLMDNMRVSAADAEHQSDDLAERFLEDKITLDEFLKQFSEQRRLLHIRKVKEEKLSQLIPNQERY